MNRTIIALLAALVLGVLPLAARPAMAQTTFGVVDPPTLLQTSEVGKAVATQMEKLRGNDERALKTQQDGVRKLEQDLNQARTTLSADDYQKRVQDIRQKAADLQRDAQSREAKLEGAYRNAMLKVETAISQIVDEINKERHFTMTFRRAAIMGSTTAPDVTQDVLKRLNQRMPTINVELPKQ